MTWRQLFGRRLFVAGMLWLSASGALAQAGRASELVEWAGLPNVALGRPAVVRVATAALILSGRSGGELDLAALATPVRRVGAKVRVSIVVELGLEALASPEPASLELFVYALDGAGEVAASRAEKLRLDVAPQPASEPAPQPVAGILKILTSLDLEPGEYALRILARRPESGRLGLLARRLAVPDLSASGELLLAPWFLAEVEPSRVALFSREADPEEAAVRPVAVGSRPHLPTARPRLEPGVTVRVAWLAQGVPRPGRGWSARFSGAGETHDVALGVALGVEDPETVPWTSLGLISGTLRVPDLPPGDYQVALVASGPEGAFASPARPVTVVGAAGESSAVVAPGDRPPAAPPARRGRSRRRLPRQEWAAAYRDVLRRLASGDPAGAGEALRGLELDASRTAPGVAVLELEETQWAVLESLSRALGEELLPVAGLHAEQFSRYRQEGASPLAEHSVRTSRRLARALARGAGSPQLRSDLAEVVTQLAGDLLRAGRWGESEELFALATDLDESHPRAALGLAVSHELTGQYGKAASVLEGTIRRDPAAHEARLRRALALARLGKSERARPLLEPLTDPPTPGWISVLAAQELARLAFRQRRLPEALAILDRALERRPGHPGLRLQRAYLLARVGRPAQAGEQIAALVGEGAATVAAERQRYNRWPDRPCEESPERARRIAERQRRLARLLEAEAP